MADSCKFWHGQSLMGPVIALSSLYSSASNVWFGPVLSYVSGRTQQGLMIRRCQHYCAIPCILYSCWAWLHHEFMIHCRVFIGLHASCNCASKYATLVRESFGLLVRQALRADAWRVKRHVRCLVSGLINPVDADLLWEKNTVGWLISPGWNQQTNRLIVRGYYVYIWHVRFMT